MSMRRDGAAARHARKLRDAAGLLARTTTILLCLAAPVLAVPAVRPDSGATIEAPTMKKTGIGLVLLVSLRRG